VDVKCDSFQLPPVPLLATPELLVSPPLFPPLCLQPAGGCAGVPKFVRPIFYIVHGRCRSQSCDLRGRDPAISFFSVLLFFAIDKIGLFSVNGGCSLVLRHMAFFTFQAGCLAASHYQIPLRESSGPALSPAIDALPYHKGCLF